MPSSVNITTDVLFYQTTIDAAIDLVTPFSPFFLSNVFKTSKQVPTIYVDYEEIDGKIGIANMIGQNEQRPDIVKNKIVKKGLKLELPRTFEEYPFTVEELLDIQNVLNSAFKPVDKAEYMKEITTEAIKTLKERRLRLHELIAAESLIYGKCSKSFPTYKLDIDYGYTENKNKITLTGDDKWDAATAPNILKQLQAWRRLCPNATQLICSTTAAEHLLNNKYVLDGLDRFNYKVGAFDLGGTIAEDTLVHGSLNSLKIIEYMGTYTDSNNDTKKYLPDGYILLINPNPNFISYSGLTMYFNDQRSLVQSIAPDNIRLGGPDSTGSVITWLNETRGIPVIKDKRQVLSIKVC